MSGFVNSFASGSNLSIRFGNIVVAYGSNLSFSDDVSHAPVGGMGSYSYDTLEPLQYVARGNFSINRFSKLATDAIAAQATPGQLPSRMGATSSGTGTDLTDGNTLLHPSQFNPARLLFSRTFDIDVYEGGPSSTALAGSDRGVSKLIFTLQNCRMTGYSIAFTPGALVGENISFMCIRVIDQVTQAGT
jgi:hypothetical protein